MTAPTLGDLIREQIDDQIAQEQEADRARSDRVHVDLEEELSLCKLRNARLSRANYELVAALDAAIGALHYHRDQALKAMNEVGA